MPPWSFTLSFWRRRSAMPGFEAEPHSDPCRDFELRNTLLEPSRFSIHLQLTAELSEKPALVQALSREACRALQGVQQNGEIF